MSNLISLKENQNKSQIKIDDETRFNNILFIGHRNNSLPHLLCNGTAIIIIKSEIVLITIIVERQGSIIIAVDIGRSVAFADYKEWLAEIKTLMSMDKTQQQYIKAIFILKISSADALLCDGGGCQTSGAQEEAEYLVPHFNVHLHYPSHFKSE